jgi:hypothetical protein
MPKSGRDAGFWHAQGIGGARERSLRRQAQRMERSGTPQSPVRALKARGCAQNQNKKIKIPMRLPCPRQSPQTPGQTNVSERHSMEMYL